MMNIVAIAALFMLCSCAAFDPPVMHAGETRCIVGDCRALLPILRELEDPDLVARIKAANPGVPRQ